MNAASPSKDRLACGVAGPTQSSSISKTPSASPGPGQAREDR
jgi:hypothetical protein